MAVLERVERRQRLEGGLPVDRHDAPEDALVQAPAPMRLEQSTNAALATPSPILPCHIQRTKCDAGNDGVPPSSHHHTRSTGEMPYIRLSLALQRAPAIQVVCEREDVVRAGHADEGLDGRRVPLRGAAEHAPVAGQACLRLPTAGLAVSQWPQRNSRRVAGAEQFC